ncbi:MAG: heavy-metal-associated domain-containing protein [Gammaproteobacteria bacterium]
MAGSLFVESPARAWIWVLSLLWMGTACMANARRCGRTHCYFTAPLFFIMACVALLDGLGLLALGPRAWTLLGLGLVIGSAGLWWGTERLWGRFLRFDSQRQASKGSLSRHHTTLWNECRGFVHEAVQSGVPSAGYESDPKKPRPNLYGETMSTYTLHITGMTCDHCARTAEDALNALPGVTAQVSYEEGIAQVMAPKDVAIERLIERVEAKGFKARLSE